VTRPVRRRTRQQDARAVALGVAAAGALGVGGLAVGSFAVAALAVGALAVGRLAPGRGQVEDVHIARQYGGELTLDQSLRGTGAGALPPVG
jgi:hypothetical protein